MEKMTWDGPKWGQEDSLPTNPDLANILGRTDLDFENFYFFHFLDPNNLDFPASKNLDLPASKKSTRRPGGRGRSDGWTDGSTDG